MQKRVLDYVRQYHMIEPGDRLVAGVSGGADSVCLLLLLKELQREIPFELAAVHVHHNLRGQEADGDASFCRELCRRQGIAFRLFSCPVEREAREKKLSLEEAGREARRRCFEDFAREWGGTKIALAHHRNDVAETMIYNLARGTGLAGLCSLGPVQGRYIRPLLGLGRPEIEEYLRERGQDWREDASNRSLEFSRNVIRHRVLPPLNEQVNSRAVEHMAAAAELLGEAREYLEGQARLLFSQYVKRQGKLWRVSQELLGQPRILRGYVLAWCLEEIRGSKRDLGRVHLESLEDLLEGRVGREICLPGRVRARREYGGLLLERDSGAADGSPALAPVQPATHGQPPVQKPRASGGAPEEGKRELPFLVPDTLKVGNWDVETALWEKELTEIPRKAYTKWLDYDKIKNTAVWRTRRTGDRMQVTREGGSKKLKDLMIDWKIPRDIRDEIWLLAVGQEVLWVPGYRLGESCKVSPKTKHIVKITVQGGNIHEREDPCDD